MKPLFFLSFFLILCCSTADEQSNENPTPNPKRETTPTTKNKLPENINTISLAYELFAAAIITTDTTKLNELIHPELGLFIIHSNGALPEMQKIFSMAGLKTEKPKLLNLNDDLFKTPLLLDDLPFMDCDFPPKFYSKSGCFADTINDLQNNPIWEYIKLSKEERKMAERSAELITHTIINTGGFKAYFSCTNNIYHLLFIDLRTPCTA